MKASGKMSARMRQVADFVLPCRTAVDVGCDHGYVSIDLLQRGIVQRVIAMDVRKGPLSRAEQNRNLAGLQSVMECRLSDGLDELQSGEADVIILAGMGGPLMMDILERGRAKELLSEQMVLQPQSDIPAVRRYLSEIGYSIQQEAFLKEDGKYYTVLRARAASNSEKPEKSVKSEELAKSEKPTQAEVTVKPEKPTQVEVTAKTAVEEQYGRYLLENRNTVLLEYLKAEEAMWRKLLQTLSRQMEQEPTPKVEKRREELLQQLQWNQMAQDYYQ